MTKLRGGERRRLFSDGTSPIQACSSTQPKYLKDPFYLVNSFFVFGDQDGPLDLYAL